MKPTKKVYVKTYTRCLDDVKSEPTDGYKEYPIYKLPMELESFDEDMIGKWHPKIELQSIRINGAIFFNIANLDFKVEESHKLADTIEISTDFQIKKIDKGNMVNNLNLFKEFQDSFILQDFVDSIIGFNGIVDSNGIQWSIEDVYYSVRVAGDHRIHFVIQSDEFGEFLINYVKTDGGYKYIGVGFSGLEVWYDHHMNIDLENEIENLKLKLELVEFIRGKLYDIYGVGMESELTERQRKASEESKKTAKLFRNFYRKQKKS